MGLFKALYVASQLLPNEKRELEVLEKEWAKSNKKFKSHVDNCLKLRNWPHEQCDECTQVAAETGKYGWLSGIRGQFEVLNTPSIEDEYSEDEFVSAAMEEWTKDPTRPPAEYNGLTDKSHNAVTVMLSDPGGGIWPGSVNVRRLPRGLECEVYVRNDADLDDYLSSS